MSTLTIVLRKDKVNSKGIAPIHFRIVKNRRSSYLSSGIKIPVKYWDEKNKRIKPGYENSARANNLLIKQYKETSAQLLDQETANKHISVRGIARAMKGTDCPGFFEVADIILKRSLADGKVATYDIRNAMLNKFKTFIKQKDIAFTDITPLLLQKYEAHLQSEYRNSANTRHRDFKFLKMVFKEAYRLDYLSGHPNPFDRYKIKQTPTTKSYLTEEEIQAIEDINYALNSPLNLYRNLFVFACTAYGIRISDLILLEKKHVTNGRILIKTKKTNHQLDVRLPQKALNTLAWCKDTFGDRRFVFSLAPDTLDLTDSKAVDLIVSRETAKYNKALKQIAKDAKLEKPVSSHTARHAWATRALRKGLDLYQVSTLLTHASVKQTQLYAKIVSEELDKAADLF